VEKIALSSDGKWALFGYGGDLGKYKFPHWVKLWDVEQGKDLCTLDGFTWTPMFLAILPDGKTAVGGDISGYLRFYEIPSGKLLRSLRVHAGEFGGAVLSPDGKVALTLGCEQAVDGRLQDFTMKLWDLTQDKLFRTTNDNCFPFAISPDHRLAVLRFGFTEASKHLAVLDLNTGKVIKQTTMDTR
jgi:WD40 repeat protein